MIDGHVHLEEELPVERLIAAMDAGGVEQAVLLAAAQRPMGPVPPGGFAVYRACMAIPFVRMPFYRRALRSKRVRPYVRPDNRPVLEAGRLHPGRFIPFVFLNASLGGESHEELERALDGGARGVKLHLWFHGYRLTDALPILMRCEHRGLPVLAHLGLGPAEDVAAVLEACPKLKLVLAHAGTPHLERLWRLPRVLFDVSGPLVSDRLADKLLRTVGPERVVYGSDAPLGIRAGGGHRYAMPALPDRAMGENLAALLD